MVAIHLGFGLVNLRANTLNRHSSIVALTRSVMTVGPSSKSEQHRPLEALWPGDEHAHSATKWISGNPSLVLPFEVPAPGLPQPFQSARGV
jgi:hypothetical protein